MVPLTAYSKPLLTQLTLLYPSLDSLDTNSSLSITSPTSISNATSSNNSGESIGDSEAAELNKTIMFSLFLIRYSVLSLSLAISLDEEVFPNLRISSLG